MVSAGNSLIKGIEVQELIDTLDSLHAQSWAVALFSRGLKNRLEGQAAFLLSKELEDKAQESMGHAKKPCTLLSMHQVQPDPLAGECRFFAELGHAYRQDPHL